jgi:hypothetical protein
VDGNCRSDVGGNFTRNACNPTSAVVSANSDSESRRDSNICWKNNVVRIAELSTVIDDVKETWRHLVKLHNLPWNAINRLGEDQGQRLKHCASDGFPSSTRFLVRDGKDTSMRVSLTVRQELTV